MNNSLLDCFKEPSENLKNFIVKYDLWFYEAKFGSPDARFLSDKNTKLKNLLKKIMKEKKNSEYFFCSYSFNYTAAHPTDHDFFYGNKNEVKDKIASYLYLLHRNKYSRSFFCVYDFVNDCESNYYWDWIL